MSKRILDFCSISGEAVKKYNGRKKYIATGDIIDNKINSYTEVEFSNKPSRANQIAKVGDVLFAKMKNTQKVISINEENSKYIYSTGFYIIKPKDNVITDYLYWLFNSVKFNRDKDKYCKGATQKAINNEGLNKIEINELPNIDIQKNIVCKLNKIKEIITKKKEQIILLDEIVKSQFVELFENKNYEKLNGKELFVFSSGKFLEASKRLENGIPVYGGNGIAWHTNEPLIDYNTIVIGRVGAYCGNVKLIKEPVWITDNAIYIKKFKKNVYNIDFLYYMMELIDFSRFAQFSGQPKITQRPLEEFEYVIPPIELQNQFSEFVKLIDKQKFEIENSLKEMQELYESLMEKYFG